MQTTSSVCPRCQSLIPADAPGGICPACALRGVVEGTGSAPFAAQRTPTAEEIAAAFPEYEILGPIGQGGMSVVFQARQPRLDRVVALKILPPQLAAQPGFAERFTREARALARLAHPHIVAVYDFGERASYYYLAMEFVDGVNLRQALRAGVTPEQALQLVPRICEALQFAHDRGVLHRDIKPENILLDRAGVPKLADFGIAKLAGDPGAATGLTATGAALGTAAYMAPEQIEKPATVDHRADIYSLGVVLYEMLTGELPLGRFAPPSEKSDVHRGIDEVVLRALEKERSRRQQSATEMKTEVEDACAGKKPAPPAVIPARPAPARPWEYIAFTLKALTALSSAGIVVSAVLGWRGIKPAHWIALVIIFGVLYQVVKSFARRLDPSAPPRAPREKDTGMAYLFWFLFGLVGGHRFYLGQIGWGLLYMVTGGLFFVGWIVDLFTLPAQVRAVNEARQRQRLPGQPLPPSAGSSLAWVVAAPIVALVMIPIFCMVGAIALPWVKAQWRQAGKDGSWSYQFNAPNFTGHVDYHSGGIEATATPATSTPPAPGNNPPATPKPETPSAEAKPAPALPEPERAAAPSAPEPK